MKRNLVILLVVCGLILAGFFFAPASLINNWLKKSSDGQFALKNTDGSLWSGEGELQLALPDGGVTVLPGVKWRIDPISVLAGKLVGQLQGAASGQFGVSGDERTAKDIRMKIPASALAAAAMLAMMSPDGLIDVNIPDARWSKDTGSGTGELVWTNASIQVPNSPQRVTLGTVRVQGQLVGPAVNFTVSNEGGAVALSGGGQWPRGGTARYDVALTPRAGFPLDQLAALTAVAKPDGTGAYRVRVP
jgi:hypothetical protein